MTTAADNRSLPAFLHPFAKPAAADFTPIVRGRGARLWTADGTELVDAMASLWYCNVGHGRGEIADAVADQIRSIAAYSCFEPFTNEPADRLAEMIVGHYGDPQARVFFTGSGSESVDTAIKLARLTHQLAGQHDRTVVISRERGYHGTNLGGTSAQGIAPNREGWGPLVPEIIQVPADDSEALSVAAAQAGDRLAAILTEPVQGAGGVHVPPAGYLEAARATADRHGALLIFDEVITGFGRLGTWFASQHFGVRPDLTTFAKGVTSGYQPLGGVVIGPTVRAAIESDPDFVLRTGYTYSGHPTACAAGVRNLELLADEQLLDRVHVFGPRLRAGFDALVADGQIAGVRGLAGVWAVQLHPHQDAPTVRQRMLDDGVITRAIGTDTCTFCPPLVATDEDIDRIVDALATATR